MLFSLNAKPGGPHTVGRPLLIIKYIQTALHAGEGAIEPGETTIEKDSEIESVIWMWVCSTHWEGEMRSVDKVCSGKLKETEHLGDPDLVGM